AAALLLEADSAMTPAAVLAKLLTYATPDVVTSPGAGSVNLLLYTKSAWLAPTPVAPSSPRELVVVAESSTVQLSWLAPTTNNGNSVTDYKIEYSSNSGSTWSTFVDGVSTAITVTVTGLTNATPYTFRVSAISSAGTSDPSNTATATPGIPGAPTSLATTALNQSVRLTWTAPSSTGGAAITDYVVEYTADVSAGYSVFNDGVSTATTAIVTGLTNGSSYYFRVKALNSIGSSQPSGVVSGAPWAIVVPSAPLDLTVTNIDLNKVSLSWSLPTSNGGSSVTDYIIEYSNNSGDTWSVFDDGLATMRSQDVTGLTNAVFYIFRVSAVNISGTGAPSTATTSVAPGVPSAPCCVRDVLIGPRRVAIQWGKPTFTGGSEITNYLIEYSTDSGANWTLWDGNTGVVGCVCETVARTVTPLADGVPHIFRVRAKNAIGTSNHSAASEAYTPWTPVVPGAPLNVVAVARTGQVDLDWDEPTTDGGAPITDYRLQFSTDSGSTWTTINDGVSSATFSSIRSLTTGVSHIFRVAASNEVGTGINSATSAPITTIAPLANDPFSGATTISSSTGYLTSSTQTATREIGEPNHGGYRPSASLWYKWVATEAGTLVLTTYGSDFDTILGVYTGASVNALTALAVNDDATGETGLWSRVTVTVAAGTTYLAAIDGYNTSKGSTRFNWTFTAAPTPEAPTAPLNVRASAGDSSATINWLAPSSNGYSAITGYTATSSPGAKTCTTTGSLSCVVRGLTNGTSYTFTVTATNAIGTSVPSSPSEAVVPAADNDNGITVLSWGLDRIDQRALPLNNRYSSSYAAAEFGVRRQNSGVDYIDVHAGTRV
ncbi:MAG: fibronectin type III domain-containing protein, partial [Actinomycetota bacterium]